MNRTIIALATLAALVLTVAAQRTATPEAQLGAIINQAEGEGNYEAAIPRYKKFIAENGKNNALAARAQYHLAVAYEKLGDAEARKVYEQIVRDFASQPVADDAKQRLAALSDLPLADRRHRLICSDCGGEEDTLSADGKTLTFGRRGSGLFVRDNVSGQLTQLISDSVNQVVSPVLSPDRKQIAYVWLTKDDHDLRVIANEVGAKPRILNKNPEYYRILPAAWAPDGKSLLARVDMQLDRTWGLAWVSTTDGSVKQLKSLGWRVPGRPVLSPDGRYVAYDARVDEFRPWPPPTDDRHIYVLSADGSTETETKPVKGASVNRDPVWTPDGKNLLFVSNRGGDLALWSVALQNGALKEVKRATGNITSMGMTSSGTYFYVRPSARRKASFVVSALNGNKAQGEETILGSLPVWSPDGKFVAFTRPVNGQTGGMFVYSLDTKDEKRYVLPAGFELEAMKWFNDGRSLMPLLRDSKGDFWLYRVDLKTSEFKKIGPAQNSKPFAISFDDKTIYLSNAGEAPKPTACRMDNIVAMDVDTGKERTVARIPEPYARQLSADDKTLYMTSCERAVLVSDFIAGNTGTWQVYDRIVAVDTATGAQKDVFTVPAPKTLADFRVSSNGRELSAVIIDDLEAWMSAGFNGGLDKNEQLIRVGLDGSGYRQLFTLPEGFMERPTWTAGDTEIRFLAKSANNPWGTLQISAGGGNPQVLYSSSISNFRDQVSPDGSHVIVTSNESNPPPPELWALDNVAEPLKTVR